jgi:hypothetical protein
MGEPIVFEAVTRLQGLQAIQTFQELLGKIEDIEFIYPKPFPGGWPVPIYEVLGERLLAQLSGDMPPLKIDGIDGGIRNPHLHLADRIVLVDRDRFKEVVGHVAMELAGKFAAEAEYVETVEALHNLVPGIP